VTFSDRINDNTLHAVLRTARPAAPRHKPAQETEAEATTRLINDVRSALATESGSTRAKQREMEARIAAIEKKMGMGSGEDARAQISSLHRQLSLARAAIQAMVKSKQGNDLQALHVASIDIKRKLRGHIIREALRHLPLHRAAHIPQVCAVEWQRTSLSSG
jgi:hypothetical protein